ncbi:hypothetical protein [Photobacterium damselae]|uniref:Uncharacterized protein n=1 Tax=Photobacterium damselae subsp. damselae TaxID=85581 RepID=A0AAD3WTX0_PHODD|nr:hypothetical protein [Photobacterium damselae]KAB1178932.1 hypothetical protein F6450_14655 [Photobacterium damselae subsp. damselae]
MDILNAIPKNGISFNYRGSHIDAELRPLWRISLLVIILMRLCSGNKANSKKIQALYSLVASEKKRKIYSSRSTNNEYLNIRFDPLVDRAIDIGVGHGLFKLDDAKSIVLTDKGISFGKRIEEDDNVFILEKNFMKQFKKSFFTEQRINSLITGER